jgi:SAM-dependent methyltransferase
MTERTWQLRLFEKSIKKKETVEAILRLLPRLTYERCLEIGCATGVTSYLLRQRGGEWVSVDFEREHVSSARSLVGDRVYLICQDGLDFASNSFDLVVGINFLEHIEQDDHFLAEMVRVLKPGGILIFTAPKGEQYRLGYALKRLYGFTADQKGFGHARDGYSPGLLRDKFQKAGLEIERLDTYSRFFTEAVEDTLNFLYHIQAMRKRRKTPSASGEFHGMTSPASEAGFKDVNWAFQVYSLLFPIIKGITLLDRLIWFRPGYMLACRAKKVTSVGQRKGISDTG